MNSNQKLGLSLLGKGEGQIGKQRLSSAAQLVFGTRWGPQDATSITTQVMCLLAAICHTSLGSIDSDNALTVCFQSHFPPIF